MSNITEEKNQLYELFKNTTYDNLAWAKLFDQTYNRLCTNLKYKWPRLSTEQIEDIIMDTFIIAKTKKPKAFKGTTDFSVIKYLQKISEYKANNLYKREKNRIPH